MMPWTRSTNHRYNPPATRRRCALASDALPLGAGIRAPGHHPCRCGVPHAYAWVPRFLGVTMVTDTL
jgi:hypothetical protein